MHELPFTLLSTQYNFVGKCKRIKSEQYGTSNNMECRAYAMLMLHEYLPFTNSEHFRVVANLKLRRIIGLLRFMPPFQTMNGCREKGTVWKKERNKFYFHFQGIP